MKHNNVYIGQLDRRIQLIQTTLVIGSSGEATPLETTFNTVWAKVEDVSGTEDEQGKIIALNVRKYVIRYDPDLVALKLTDMFIVDDDGKYNIHAVEFIGRKQYIMLKCSKRE
jgi:SPP1 family predicted phage head-tail adaptor